MQLEDVHFAMAWGLERRARNYLCESLALVQSSELTYEGKSRFGFIVALVKDRVVQICDILPCCTFKTFQKAVWNRGDINLGHAAAVGIEYNISVIACDVWVRMGVLGPAA